MPAWLTCPSGWDPIPGCLDDVEHVDLELPLLLLLLQPIELVLLLLQSTYHAISPKALVLRRFLLLVLLNACTTQDLVAITEAVRNP